MKFLLSAALLAVGLLSASRAAEEENPFKKANVDDWVEYKLSTSSMNIILTGKMKLTVTAKTETEATVTPTITINDQTVPAPAVKIDLTKPFDPTSVSGLPASAGAVVEKGDTGKEKLTIAGKEYECATTKMKLVAKVMNEDIDSDVKIWINKDIPLTGLAKMDLKSRLADFVMEYTGAGTKAPDAK